MSGLDEFAGAMGLEELPATKGLAGSTGATGGRLARLGGTGREELTRGGSAVNNFGRANGERFTGGWNGMNSGGTGFATVRGTRDGRISR